VLTTADMVNEYCKEKLYTTSTLVEHKGRPFSVQKVYNLGFISIRRYRDIDRGIGDLAIIAALRDCTIS